MSTIHGCLASQIFTSAASSRSTVSLRPVASARLNSSSSSSPPSLIRNEPVFAAPAPIIHPLLKEDMGKDSYEEAIVALQKLLSFINGLPLSAPQFLSPLEITLLRRVTMVKAKRGSPDFHHVFAPPFVLKPVPRSTALKRDAAAAPLLRAANSYRHRHWRRRNQEARLRKRSSFTGSESSSRGRRSEMLEFSVNSFTCPAY